MIQDRAATQRMLAAAETKAAAGTAELTQLREEAAAAAEGRKGDRAALAAVQAELHAKQALLASAEERLGAAGTLEKQHSLLQVSARQCLASS